MARKRKDRDPGAEFLEFSLSVMMEFVNLYVSASGQEGIEERFGKTFEKVAEFLSYGDGEVHEA